MAEGITSLWMGEEGAIEGGGEGLPELESGTNVVPRPIYFIGKIP